MEVIGYENAEHSSIAVIVDGQRTSVPNDMSNRFRQEIAEWEGTGGIIPPYIEPSPIPPVVTPSVFATAKLSIDDGVMSGFSADSRIAGGFQLDTGYFMLILSEPITSEYIASAFDGGLYRLYVKPEDYAEDYFIVTCTNLQGDMADPDNISVVIITTE